jgi:hypothetical protein
MILGHFAKNRQSPVMKNEDIRVVTLMLTKDEINGTQKPTISTQG